MHSSHIKAERPTFFDHLAIDAKAILFCIRQILIRPFGHTPPVK